MGKRFEKVVVLEHGDKGHPRVHWDEVVAVFLLTHFGEPLYPGVAESGIEVWKTPKDATGLEDLNKWREKKKKEGTYILPLHSHEKDAQDCTATLVAKELGILDYPALRRILDHVLEVDLKGTKNPFDISRCFESVMNQNIRDFKKCLEWAFICLESEYAQQFEFHHLQQTLHEITKVEVIKEARVAFVHSDHEMAKSAAVNQYKPDLVVLINSKGNVKIFGGLSYKIDFRNVVKAIRIDEQVRLHGDILTSDFNELLHSEIKGDNGRWFYHVEAQNLYNGSLSVPNIPPTTLKEKDLIVAIKKAIFELHPKCSGKSCIGRNCQNFCYGFTRCRAIRRKEYEARQSRKRKPNLKVVEGGGSKN